MAEGDELVGPPKDSARRVHSTSVTTKTFFFFEDFVRGQVSSRISLKKDAGEDNASQRETENKAGRTECQSFPCHTPVAGAP